MRATRPLCAMQCWFLALAILGCVLAGCTATRSAQTGGSISAAPNPVAAGDQPATTTVHWTTSDGSIGEVYVSQDGGPERLFGQATQGSQDAPWITNGHTYEFRLYAGTTHSTQLGAVTVTTGPPGSGGTGSAVSASDGSKDGFPPPVPLPVLLLLAVLASVVLLVGTGVAVRRGKPRLGQILCTVLAGLVTLASALSILGAPQRPLAEQPFPDAQEYADAAHQLEAGHGYVTLADSGTPQPPRYPPGFSLALTPFAFIGDYPSNVQLGSKLLVLMYLFATLSVAWILGGPLTAALASAIIGLSPFAATSASLVMSDAFAAALSVLLVGIFHQMSGTRMIAGGGLVGAMVLVRLSALAGLIACLAAVPRRHWPHVLIGAIPFIVALGLYQWSTFGNPVETGYDYWLPGLRAFDASFAVRGGPQGDGPYIVADRLDGALLQPVCRCPASNPQSELPNLAFYPAVLLGLFWIFAPPGVGLVGLVYTWSRRREPAFRLVLSLTISGLGVQIFYFYQGARFMAGPATLLAIACAVGVGRWTERRLFGWEGVLDHATQTASPLLRDPVASADARGSVRAGRV
jgi:hypothetical protein